MADRGIPNLSMISVYKIYAKGTYVSALCNFFWKVMKRNFENFYVSVRLRKVSETLIDHRTEFITSTFKIWANLAEPLLRTSRNSGQKGRKMRFFPAWNSLTTIDFEDI